MTNLATRNSQGPSFVSELDSILSEFLLPNARGYRGSWATSLRVNGPYRDEDSIYAEVEVPGTAPEDITVQLEGKAILVKTPRGQAYITVGERLNIDETTATLKHGMLTVRIPTREARKVEIRVEVED